MPDISYPATNGDAPAYLAVPDGHGPWPGVLVVQDVLGMTADLRRNTDRFADSGYLALAPALYGRGPKIRCLVRTLCDAVAGHGTAHDDLVAARDYLVADTRCTGKVGLAGFCMGADVCLQLAPRGLFDATAPNYGHLPKDFNSLSRSCPVVASYGAKDMIVSRGTASKLETMLAQGDVPRDVKEYPNVAHSFMNDWRLPWPGRVVERIVRLSYSEPEAEDAWQRIVSFFKEHLN
ncbi:dienelactone hydrolase family protein [Mycobacterium sp. 852002-40037_SCH5390672]|uniref:dienelactone hydrolase family protein n=1 Tax=Mycobacterium sp. 852002-40037_SCH5390672 TaxID=1834089 RepID=UPI000804FEF1|nr:dienelactone hydrolase family protein [Mycobacterium sp. 852002-40037_SCH5390672]OBB98545.1 carboxymethylenebutenolidase [Mycobacterium sp. 852002-40037_SCH5390672]